MRIIIILYYYQHLLCIEIITCGSNLIIIKEKLEREKRERGEGRQEGEGNRQYERNYYEVPIFIIIYVSYSANITIIK